ncbi:MAG: S8 family serine peptidase, partial [Oscillibacter sp.]
GDNYIRPQDGTEDKIGHGTAIAGILVGSDAAGVPGICPEAQLVPLVYYSQDEGGKTVKGNTAMVAQMLFDAVDVYGCRVINLSSGAISDTESLRAATAYAAEKNALLVTCAGNDNLDHPTARYYPAAYDTALTVGAVNRNGTVSSFSQRNDTVDILAPGTNLWVANIRGNKFRAAGTSYATAYAAGAAAKLLEQTPALTAAQLRQILCASAQDIGPEGYDTDSGWGVLDTETALAWAAQGRLFRDTPPEAWYFASVNAAVEAKLFGGTDAVHFSPDAPMTRAMLWTVLARHAGQDTAGGGSWFEKARTWAMETGISDGENPDAQITREQLVTTLWRYAASPEAAADLSAFADGESVSPYAAPAMAWAHQTGLVQGSGGKLHPQAPAPRAQVAALMLRLLQSADPAEPRPAA